jgi:hypothetical protein
VGAPMIHPRELREEELCALTGSAMQSVPPIAIKIRSKTS